MVHFFCLHLQTFILSAFPSSHRCLHILLTFNTHTHTHGPSGVSECCGPMLSSGCHNPMSAVLFGRKVCNGQILFRQIKKSTSSCLHQSTHCVCDGPTRYTPALLRPCLSLFHIHLILSGCITFSVTLLRLPLVFIFAAVSM